jgi:hypothetical protein
MKIIIYIKAKIRLLVLYFYLRTMNFITNDLHQRIFEYKNDQKELQNILKEILILKEKYPNEPEITRAETIVTRLLIMKS